MARTREFDAKYAWITGGSRGIGRAITAELLAEGFSVSPFSSEDLNLSDQQARRSWLNSREKFPGILVLNAGVNQPESFELQADVAFQNTLEVNLLANRDILKEVLPEMKRNKFGRIVVISSLYATKVREGRSAYSISKAALEALARSIAIEYADSGVMINVVAPGFVRTSLTEKNNSPAQILDIKSQIPLNRLAQPEEVARVVTFLLSEKNTYMTGQTINVDGGLSIK